MAITRVQGGTHQNGVASASTCVVTISAVGAGNMVCVTASGQYTGGTLTFSVADDKGNTYTSADLSVNTTANFGFATFYLLNVANGPTIFTATRLVGGAPAAATFSSIQVDEFSGVVAADGHIINGQTNPATTADAVTSTNITTTGDGDLIYGTTVDITGNGTITKGTPFTQDLSVAGIYMTEHLIQSAHGAIAATFKASVTTDTWITAVMAFKAAAPTGGAGRISPAVFRPGQGPSRGLDMSLSTFIPAQVATVSLTAFGAALAKTSAAPRGAIILSANAVSMAEGRAIAGASAALAAKGAAQGKGAAAVLGAAAMSARGMAQATGRARASGVVGLLASTQVQAKAIAASFIGLLLQARAQAQAKARAAPSGAAAITARGTGQAKTQAAIAGAVGLAAVTKAMAQARATPLVMANLVALAGAIKGMASGRAVVSAAAALQALTTQGAAQAKGAAALAGRVQLAATAKGQAQAAGVTGLFAMLVAAGRAQAQGRAPARLLAMLSGSGTAQSGARAAAAGTARLVSRGAAQATASAPVGAIAALTALVARGAGMAASQVALYAGVGVVTHPPGGAGYTGIRSFTRKRWKELQDLIAAEQALARKPQPAPLAVTEGARDALEALEEFAPVEARAQFERDMKRLTGMVEGAAKAKKISVSAARARVANAAAVKLQARVEAYLEQEEEEIRMLLE